LTLIAAQIPSIQPMKTKVRSENHRDAEQNNREHPRRAPRLPRHIRNGFAFSQTATLTERLDGGFAL